jgi:hypothetical protein
MDWAGKLRHEIREGASRWSTSEAVSHYESLGNPSTILFNRATDGNSHGNFQLDSWRAIAGNQSWSRRLEKHHSQRDALPVQMASDACELDSSNSSDALLMNCFCFPGAAAQIMKGLSLPEPSGDPEFGIKAKLPLAGNLEDATELDMKIGSHIFEGKLTEHNFTSSPIEHVRRYRDLESIFDVALLPSLDNKLSGYQLIRNVLAAAHLNASLIVLLDQRRPDLLEEWWRVHSCIKSPDLRLQCGVRTWQQVAAASPPPLARFLAEKYGL